MAKSENKRFEIVYKNGSLSSSKIIRDNETGVCYLWHEEGYAGGLTPLLNRDGTPVIMTVGVGPDLG